MTTYDYALIVTDNKGIETMVGNICENVAKKAQAKSYFKQAYPELLDKAADWRIECVLTNAEYEHNF